MPKPSPLPDHFDNQERVCELLPGLGAIQGWICWDDGQAGPEFHVAIQWLDIEGEPLEHEMVDVCADIDTASARARWWAEHYWQRAME